MKTYAFIDVPNTSQTTKTILGFTIDWKKLYPHLKGGKWTCNGIYFFKGHKGQKELNQFKKLEKLGYIVRTKLTHSHPDRVEEIDITCDVCTTLSIHKYVHKGNKKSNCDVELTVDAMTVLSKGDRALLFTGDGDFSYLIETLVDRGVIVYIISSQNNDARGKSRFSTRLKKLIRTEEDNGKKRVRFIHIDNWKNIIQK